MTRHVWIGRKVTPWAGSGGRYSRRSYRWHSVQELKERQLRADLRRWREISRKNTIAEPSRQIASLASGRPGHHFRRLDASGKATGPRWVIETWPDIDGYVGCADSRGNTRMLPREESVRFVARQPEDPHSAACRALKRAHRQGLEA